MESIKKKRTQIQGLPPFPRRPDAADRRPFSMVPPTTLPLASNAFRVWKKPYLLSNGGSSAEASGSGTKLPLSVKQFDHGYQEKTLSLSSSSIDHNQNKNQNPSPLPVAAAGDTDVSKKSTTSVGHERMGTRNLNPSSMDPRKLKRIISNRISAQKSRMKKMQYVIDMEKKIQALEAQVAILSPQVALYRNQQHLLQLEHQRLSEEVSVRTSNKILKDAEIQENRAEVNRLRQLYMAQQRHKFGQAAVLLPPPAAAAPWEKYGFKERVVRVPNLALSRSDQGGHMSYNYNKALWGETRNASEVKNLKRQQQLEEEVWVPSRTHQGLSLQQPMTNISLYQNINGSPKPLQKEDSNSTRQLDGGIGQILEFSLKPVNQN